MSVDVNGLKALAKPFPKDSIRWRVGSTTGDKKKGMALAYLDARDVMNRLDDVLGQDNWQDTYTHDGVRSICQLSVRVGSEWIIKSDGAGETDIEGAKGGISDAFKRAAVKWGVGRYLYALPTRWEEIESAGRSYKFTNASKARLRGETVENRSDPQQDKPDGPPSKPSADGPQGPSEGKPPGAPPLPDKNAVKEVYNDILEHAKAKGISKEDLNILLGIKAADAKFANLPAEVGMGHWPTVPMKLWNDWYNEREQWVKPLGESQP